MIKSLNIKNFKAWQDTGAIRLAPITAFFGSNSAGKTSILQFLLMLKQTAESPDRARVLHAGDALTYVELGTYQDLIFDHDPARDIEFSMSWRTDKPVSFSDPSYPASRDIFGGSDLGFRAVIGTDQKGSQFVRELEYEVYGHEDLHQVDLRMAPTPTGRGYELSSNVIQLKRFQGRAWKLPSPVRFYGFPDEVSAYYQNAGFASQLALELERMLKRIHYLGPLRDEASRTYTWSGEFPEYVGMRGDRAIDAILAASDRSISPGKHKRSLRFAEMISRWLAKLELLQSFKTKPIAKGRKEYEVEVRAQGSRLQVLLPDVGFGISQVLPVVVECFYAPADSTIIIEQPELHLHPRVQSHLADLFIEAINARENGTARNIQFIIESHSEHFLRRLQRRVAEGTIKTDDVALYFCEPGESGSKITEIKIDMFGEILNWPTDFFGDEMGDMTARLEAASRKEAQLK